MSEHQDPLALAAAAFEDIFAHYPVMEAFRPLHQSRLWALNQTYWQRKGPTAFTRDAVPYHVTNDSSLAVAAAESMIAWIRAKIARGLTPPCIALLELGPGTGLFARLTARYYARRRAQDAELPALHYLAIDGAASMIEALRERRLLEVDGIRFDFAVLDLAADTDRLGDIIESVIPRDMPLFAVANYVLDSLPSTQLRLEGGRIVETIVELRARDVVSERLDDPHLMVRQKRQPCDPNDPLVRLAARFLKEEGTQIAVNIGAFRLLQALSTAVRERGCILINDYAADMSESDYAPYQHFAGSIATGLHFPSIEVFVTDILGWRVVQPDTVDASIISRLLIAQPDEALCAEYRRRFMHPDARRAQALVATARRSHQEGRIGQAVAFYEAAIAAQPDNWSIATETAGFALNVLGEPRAAARLARLALEGNPLCAPAWNILGDCAYRERDLNSAIEAYRRADAASGGDARALLNLAYCACMDENLEDAMLWIARALTIDVNGDLRAEILRCQGEVLTRLPGPRKGSIVPRTKPR
ncbi:hypothetical protein BE17_53005 [Sorangium cellulosum]|uniref:Uncharacterized protein n=1 Tax=Sorangium cellulosum TaxID=56 RepID=A0A150RWA5_SORCE|nr:hypothetical protein BE17_53005 [Sorangium cellulosum]